MNFKKLTLIGNFTWFNKISFIAFVAFFPFGVALQAASSTQVVVKPVEPFAFERNGKIVGYSVDLWNKISAEVGLENHFTTVTNIPDLLGSIHGGTGEVGVGAISITEEREKSIDFCHPFYDSGLQVLTNVKSGGGGGLSAFKVLFSGPIVEVVLVVLTAVIVVSNVLWLFERRINSESFPESYQKGRVESAWWSISTLISGGCENKAPVGLPGRLVAVTWMLGGIALTSFITATLSSAMTVSNFTGDVKSLAEAIMNTAGVAEFLFELEDASSIDSRLWNGPRIFL